MKILKKLLPTLFFLFISSLVIFSWFRFGHLYGGGEVGIPTYNIEGAFERSKFIWWDKIGPGFPVPQSATSVPFFFVLLLLSKLGLSPLSLQIFWFFLLLFLMGFGMYLYGLALFGKEKKIYAFIAGLYYMFNPYMMVQIWHRFVYSSIFFVAAVPFLALTFRLWIKKRSFFWLLIFQIVNLLAIYSYGTIAFIISLWLLLGLFSVIEELVPWPGKKQFLNFALRFGLGFGFWLVINAWWLISFFSVGPGLLAEQHGISDNLYTLISISYQTALPYTLQLINPFYIFSSGDFGQIYNNFIFKFIPWLAFVIILIGFLSGLRQKKYVSWSINFLIIILLTKGVATPFGFLYQLGFSHFFPLGIIRNPFEKIGILLPFIVSILLVLGLQDLIRLLRKRLNKNLTLIFVCLILLAVFIYLWPMFLGKIFGTIDNPNFVQVPGSYKSADQFIAQQDHNRQLSKKGGKILHLPLTRQEAVTYRWEYGYRGVEDSALIFNSLPSLSHGLNLTRVDDSLTALSLLFDQPYSIDLKDKILKILQDFNVEFIVLHKDIDWQGGEIYQPNIAGKLLNQLDFLENKQIFGDLVVYELAEKYYQPRITLSNDVQVVYPADGIGIWPWLKNETGNFVSPIEGPEFNPNYLSNKFMIFPKSSFNYDQYSADDLLGTFNSFSSSIDNSNSILSQLSDLQSNLYQQGEIEASSLLGKIISATKELFNKDTDDEFNKHIENYNKYINQIIEKQIDNRLFIYVRSQIIADVFQMHIYMLTRLQKNFRGDNQLAFQILPRLQQYLVTNNLLPLHNVNNEISSSRRVNKFQIPKTAAYELFMVNPQIFDYYNFNNENIAFQINDKYISLKGNKQDNFISFGPINLDQGTTEINFDRLYSINLFPEINKFKKEGMVELKNDSVLISAKEGQFGLAEAEVLNALGGSFYRVNLEYQIMGGEGFRIQLIEDSDKQPLQITPKTYQEAIKFTSGLFIPNEHTNGSLQKYSFYTPILKLTTKNIRLRFLALPTVNELESETKVLIRSLKIERVLNDMIFLQRHNNSEKLASNSGEILNIDQKNPTLYLGKIKINSPTFVFFKESFHPGWKLTLISDGVNYVPQEHLLGDLYGNVWFIEKTGEFNFRLEFTPQKDTAYGLFLSLIGTISLLILVIYSIKRTHEKK